MTSNGFFKTALDAIVENRQRSANRQINNFLLGLSDETLRRYGYERDDVRRLFGRS